MNSQHSRPTNDEKRPNRVTCPNCGSEYAHSFTDRDHRFLDVQTKKEYEANVIYMRCLNCGEVYELHYETPNVDLGPLRWGDTESEVTA